MRTAGACSPAWSCKPQSFLYRHVCSPTNILPAAKGFTGSKKGNLAALVRHPQKARYAREIVQPENWCHAGATREVIKALA